MKNRVALVTVLAVLSASALAAPSGKGPKSADTLASLDCNPDEIARYNGTVWVCSSDRVGSGGSGFKVVDANGIPVLSPASWVGFDEVFGCFEADIAGTVEWFNFGVRYPNRLDTDSGLVFSSSDCSGTPYLTGFEPGWGTKRSYSFTLGNDPSNPGLKLFYSELNPVVTQITIGSSLLPVFADGNLTAECFPSVPPITAGVYAISGTINLEGRWTAPFRLVFE